MLSHCIIKIYGANAKYGETISADLAIALSKCDGVSARLMNTLIGKYGVMPTVTEVTGSTITFDKEPFVCSLEPDELMKYYHALNIIQSDNC